MPALVGIVVVAPDFVAVVLGDKWAAAAPMIQVLAWVGIVQSLQSLNIDVLQARGQTLEGLPLHDRLHDPAPRRVPDRAAVGRDGRRSRLCDLDHAGRADLTIMTARVLDVIHRWSRGPRRRVPRCFHVEPAVMLSA